MPSRNFFEDLIHKIDCENPKAFVLPAEIKGFFKNGQSLCDSTACLFT